MNELLGRLAWFVIPVVLAVIACGLWVIAARMIALKVVAMVAMERNWETVHGWEVYAMAGVVYLSLPRIVKALISEVTLAEASMRAWDRGARWYRKHNPRGTSLFPEQSP